MELINSIIKLTAINVCASISYFKLINFNKTSFIQKLIAFLSIIFLSVFQSILQNYTPFLFRFFMVTVLFSIIYSKLTQFSLSNSIISITISYTLTFIINYISLFFVLLSEKFNILHINFSDTSSIIISSLITIIAMHFFFKIKRFKNGFPFLNKKLKDTYTDIYILVISSIIVLLYFFTGNFYNIPITYIFISFLFFSLVMLIIIQKTFILYQKQKLQEKALKDYEQELSETKQKLETAIQEKERIVKSNHEFYHRQEALNKKLDILMQNKIDAMNTEFGNDYSDLLDRLNTLSDEYKSKTNFLPSLVKTNIVEIDDMLIYMQSECAKNNIEFNAKIDCDINHILTNFITKSQLETLLGDLIRNAIIAINYSSNSYKSILVIFGIKDDAYEICIYDSGIPFEINTLINLGMQPASTHLDDGGTGIGFITTFETINSCKASFVINEITNNNYTKSLEIKFDNKNEYVILSDRNDKIITANNSNRNIILQ